MTHARRGLLLIGLALVLGGLAASDVASREAAVAQRLAPLVDVVIARQDLAAGERLKPGRLGMRRIPARYAPPGAVGSLAEVAGARLAAAIERGGYVTVAALAAPDAAAIGPPVRRGERALEIVASGPVELVAPGARVDVLVTREGGAGEGGTDLALQDAEVLAARAAPEIDGGAGPRVAATLRVTLRQAVYLSAAQAFARDVRLLPRAAGDRRRSRAIRVGEGL